MVSGLAQKMKVRGVILNGAAATVRSLARRMNEAGVKHIIVVCGAAQAAQLQRDEPKLSFALAHNPSGEVDALRQATEFLGRDAVLVAVKDGDVGALLHQREKKPRAVLTADGCYFFNTELQRALSDESLGGEKNLDAVAQQMQRKK